MGVLSAAVQKDHPRRRAAPAQRADGSRLDPLDFRQWTIDTGLLSVLSQQGSSSPVSSSSDSTQRTLPAFDSADTRQLCEWPAW